MSGLTPEERELLAVWDDGTYLCPRQRGVCNDRCAKQHQGLADVVERIVAAREAAAKKEQHYYDANRFDEYADQHGFCLAGGMRISDCATGPCDCGWESLPDQLAAAEKRGAVNALREAADEIPAQVAIATETRRRIGSWLRDRADQIENGANDG